MRSAQPEALRQINGRDRTRRGTVERQVIAADRAARSLFTEGSPMVRTSGSSRPCPERRLAVRARKVCRYYAQHTPRQNHLLAALPPGMLMSACCADSGAGSSAAGVDRSRRRRPGRARVFPDRRHRFAGLCDGRAGRRRSSRSRAAKASSALHRSWGAKKHDRAGRSC